MNISSRTQRILFLAQQQSIPELTATITNESNINEIYFETNEIVPPMINNISNVEREIMDIDISEFIPPIIINNGDHETLDIENTPFLIADDYVDIVDCHNVLLESVVIDDITEKGAYDVDLNDNQNNTNYKQQENVNVEDINAKETNEAHLNDNEEDTNEKEAEQLDLNGQELTDSTDEVHEDTTKKGTKRKRRKFKTSLKERKLKKVEEIKVAHKVHLPCDVNKCRKKCVQKFKDEERIVINKNFWELNYRERRLFIINNTITKPINRRRGGEDSSRNNTFEYFLKSNASRVQVCKTFFFTTLGFSKNNNTVVHDVLCQGSPKSDRRGKHNKPNKVDREVIRTHIESFHPCVSHYRREHAPHKRYLPSDVTVSSMYKHFQETHESFKCSYDLYRSVVSEMNISFTKLGHEECESCEFFRLHNRGHTKENLIADCDDCSKWKVHIEKAKEKLSRYLNIKIKAQGTCKT